MDSSISSGYDKRVIARCSDVRLCTFVADDASLLVRWFNDAGLRQLLCRTEMVTLEQEQAYLQRLYSDCGPFAYGILPNGETAPVGLCGLVEVHAARRTATFGIFLLEERVRRRGIGEAATRLVLDMAFNKLGLRRVVAITRFDNDAFHRLAAKIGFQKEGVLREYYWFDEASIDAVQYSILRCEWMK